MLQRGLFIVIEGGEGSGKTTQISMLKERLTGENLVFTREPGGTKVSEEIREIILSKSKESRHPPLPLTEAMLFCAARAQHVAEFILPKIRAGIHVICDRFYPSTIAYQIYGWLREDIKDNILLLNAIATKGLTVDHVIYLDVSPEVGLNRKNSQKEEINRLDELEIGFHRRVRNSFLDQFQASSTFPSWHMIKTDRLSVEDTHTKILQILQKIL